MRNSICKGRLVIPGDSQRLVITHDHILRANRTQRIHLQATGVPIDTKHLTLAVLLAICSRTGRVVVIKETVQTGTVDHRVTGIQQTQAQ